MDDSTLEPTLRQLHDHLAATREQPIEREASRWIGEADAIAEDLAAADLEALERAVIWKRVGHIADLLSNVEETGDETADDHVASARELAETILAAE